VEQYLFKLIGTKGTRDPVPFLATEVPVPLEFQEDYGVYALYMCIHIQGEFVTPVLQAAALREWQQRYPEGGNTADRFWAVLMDRWVEKRLPFLQEEKRRSVSVELVATTYSSWEPQLMKYECYVVFGDGWTRVGAVNEVPKRNPNTEEFFMAELGPEEKILVSDRPTGYGLTQKWELRPAERLPRKPTY